MANIGCGGQRLAYNKDLGSIFLARSEWVSQTKELLGFSIKKYQSSEACNERKIDIVIQQAITNVNAFASLFLHMEK